MTMTHPAIEASCALEFWFELGSNYSYLSVMRIEELAQQHGVAIVWRPFLLGPIFKAFGWDTSPFVLQKEKGAYMWRDMSDSVKSTACDGPDRANFRGERFCRPGSPCWVPVKRGSAPTAND